MATFSDERSLYRGFFEKKFPKKWKWYSRGNAPFKTAVISDSSLSYLFKRFFYQCLAQTVPI